MLLLYSRSKKKKKKLNFEFDKKKNIRMWRIIFQSMSNCSSLEFHN